MNSEYDRQVGQNIKRIRLDRNWSQELLAAKLQLMGCDLTRSAVAKIEIGQRHIYMDEIILFKIILKTEYSELFDIVPPEDDDWSK